MTLTEFWLLLKSQEPISIFRLIASLYITNGLVRLICKKIVCRMLVIVSKWCQNVPLYLKNVVRIVPEYLNKLDFKDGEKRSHIGDDVH